ncbi:MAG: glycosyltransferase family 4 protein [Chloroflexi bacterium]|nr:glycosyltransferase family 4 protein [Chloroflexota bacterium]
MNKTKLKDLLGDLPYTAELYWLIQQSDKPPMGGYSADKLKEALPRWVEQAKAAQRPKTGKRVLIFTMLRYWVEHSAMTALALAALGHEVTLAYLPHAHWKKPVSKFDLRRQDLYLKDALKPLNGMVQTISLLDAPQADSLPEEISKQLDAAAYRDTQYSLLHEEIDVESNLYAMRHTRDLRHASVILAFLQKNSFDAITLPNGSILEFGMTFKVAQYLNIPVTTYEYGEQSERIWMAQNADVMRQDTSNLWNAKKDTHLSEAEWDRVKDFFSARQGGGLWENFSRTWQNIESQGASKVREELGLDERPLILLPANVLGDSLTLGRHTFSKSMTEWMTRTIEFFAKRDDVQFVLRVHPGEGIGWGLSVYDILTEKYPELPENIHILRADAKINTYDLVNTADIGLVFTTTVGMEMAMIGLPVIVTGQTHYRGKGFTLEPNSWEEYFEILEKVIADPKAHAPSREDVESAWTYAYRFFFEYPQPYPWHVQHFWEDEEKWPLEKVMTEEGLSKFEKTFSYLAGEKIDWQ